MLIVATRLLINLGIFFFLSSSNFSIMDSDLGEHVNEEHVAMSKEVSFKKYLLDQFNCVNKFIDGYIVAGFDIFCCLLDKGSLHLGVIILFTCSVINNGGGW